MTFNNNSNKIQILITKISIKVFNQTLTTMERINKCNFKNNNKNNNFNNRIIKKLMMIKRLFIKIHLKINWKITLNKDNRTSNNNNKKKDKWETMINSRENKEKMNQFFQIK